MRKSAKVPFCFFILLSYFLSVPGLYGGCECRPCLTTAGVVHVGPEGRIALIERAKEPWGLALFGGHIKLETPEEGFLRVLKQELKIEAKDVYNLSLIGVYGAPGRDFRQHSVEVTFVCCTQTLPQIGEDVKSVALYDIKDVKKLVEEHPERFAFDHAQILKEYLKRLGGYNPNQVIFKYGLNVMHTAPEPKR